MLFWTQVLPNPQNPPGQTHTWLWSINAPQNVRRRNVPNPGNGSEDLFCSGHTWLPNGNLIAFGGTDLTQSHLTGHTGVYLFSSATEQWQTSVPKYPSGPPPADPLQLPTKRWYPYGFVLPAQSAQPNLLLVLGHTDLPAGNERYLDTLNMASGNQFQQQTSRLLGSVICDIAAPGFPVNDYPRACVLALADQLFYRETGGMSRSAFLRYDVNCAVDAHRWLANATTPTVGVGGPPVTDHIEGNLVHFVTLDAFGNPIDTIYMIGGIDRLPAGGYVTTGAVEKMQNPTPMTLAWTDVPDLQYARTFANAVILADGSILVVGGDIDPNADDNLFGVQLTPERYEPPEVFGAGFGASWAPMASQAHGRSYHSVAGMVADGRVYSAGGNDPGSGHSVEIYHPPYLFKGARPEIIGAPTEWGYGGITAPFTVNSRPGTTIARFPLLRNGSITHGYDSNQRYVELETGPPLGSSFQLLEPADQSVAPRSITGSSQWTAEACPASRNRFGSADQRGQHPCSSPWYSGFSVPVS